MFFVNRIVIALILISSLVTYLEANEEKKSSIYYVTFGVASPPGDFSSVLPNFGVGARFQRGFDGLDLSANYASIGFINYASIKSLYLFYPKTEKQNQLYFGIGPGVGYHLSFFPILFPFVTHQMGNVTVEAVVGYEFRHFARFNTFIQLEISQPVFGFSKHGHRCKYMPGITLQGGIGF